MFYAQGYAGAATKRYAAVHAGSRIEGATPHGLVKILFDELLFAMDAAAVARRQNERGKAVAKLTRALSILHALESSLDFENGGDIAVGLAQIYRAARKLLLSGMQSPVPDDIEKARATIAEIAEAWNSIG
jgi:flagellar protein FliS